MPFDYRGLADRAFRSSMHRTKIDPHVRQTIGPDLMGQHNNAVVFNTGSFDFHTLSLRKLRLRLQTKGKPEGATFAAFFFQHALFRPSC